ncbi:hypothetical protein GQ53DRAFT_672747 [Thozetella sp. PMI_491]|nr:hypothetical protein GQ53DRAFT_672747 [Thozetella sp. PMI_491]
MFSYIVGFFAILVLFYNPISQLLSSEVPQIVRRPLPRQLNEDLFALESAHHNDSACPPAGYSVHIFSKAPLVLYVENFLLPEERAHLLEISEPLYKPSTITHDGGASTHRDATVRDSEVAIVPRTSMVRCIEARVRALQGWRDEIWVERLRVQRYRTGGHYNHHFDWSTGRGGWGRNQDAAQGADEAGGELQSGATFRPVAGNAVFWENFRPDGTGRGFDETWHAGLPVQKGVKVGLNIWSWGRID